MPDIKAGLEPKSRRAPPSAEKNAPDVVSAAKQEHPEDSNKEAPDQQRVDPADCPPAPADSRPYGCGAFGVGEHGK
jgi:hypothetical protein